MAGNIVVIEVDPWGPSDVSMEMLQSLVDDSLLRSVTDLRLYCFSRRKGQGFPHEFDDPLGYPTRGLPVMVYLS
jgi:hypothetical protein